VYVAAKVALVGVVAAGFMALSSPVHAATINDTLAEGPVSTNVLVGSFGIGDVLISHRSWSDAFAGQSLDISYLFTASGNSGTSSTATSLNADPPNQGDFGIANLVLTWIDDATNAILSSQQFTDANGVLNTSVILAQVLTNTKDYTLRLTGTLLGDGGGYIARVEAIPLPAGLLLFLSGLAGIGFLGRYKAKRSEPAAA
jgi:hypothetical protein